MNDLSRLSDQELNEMCCKKLGWEWVKYVSDLWENNPNQPRGWWRTPEGRGYEYPLFCSDLNLIQQHLVPIMNEWDKQKIQTFLYHAWGPTELTLPLEYAQILVVNAPARVRVLAFLKAMGVEK